MSTILVAAKDLCLREGIRVLLSTTDEHKLVGEVTNRLELVAKLYALSIQVLLLDLKLDGPTGEALIRRIKKIAPKVYIIGISDIDDICLNVRVIKAGLKGFIKKNCSKDEFLLAVVRATEGQSYITDEVSQQLAEHLASHLVEFPHQRLTERELDICEKIMRGTSINAIASEIFLSNKTVSSHKRRLLQKMGCSNVAELVVYAKEHNLI